MMIPEQASASSSGCVGRRLEFRRHQALQIRSFFAKFSIGLSFFLFGFFIFCYHFKDKPFYFSPSNLGGSRFLLFQYFKTFVLIAQHI